MLTLFSEAFPAPFPLFLLLLSPEPFSEYAFCLPEETPLSSVRRLSSVKGLSSFGLSSVSFSAVASTAAVSALTLFPEAFPAPFPLFLLLLSAELFSEEETSSKLSSAVIAASISETRSGPGFPSPSSAAKGVLSEAAVFSAAAEESKTEVISSAFLFSAPFVS